jgi:hypothetical protein
VRRIIALAMVAAMMALAAAPAQAQDISLHRHLLTTPGTSNVEVAQGICKQELLDPALVNLHENFHLGQPTAAFATNPVDETAAPCP